MDKLDNEDYFNFESNVLKRNHTTSITFNNSDIQNQSKNKTQKFLVSILKTKTFDKRESPEKSEYRIQRSNSLFNANTVKFYLESKYLKSDEEINKYEDEIQEQFFQFYQDIKFNTEDNYNNYVCLCLKSSYFLPNIDWEDEIVKRKLIIPEKNKKSKTLYLDLDETLIHCDFDQVVDISDPKIVTEIINIEDIPLRIIIRPYLNEFLNTVSRFFELVIFTASSQEYADSVLSRIDPGKKFFNYCLYRDDCILVSEGILVKDLRIIENRDLKNSVIVDNNIFCFINNLSNGILIPSFYGDPEDKSLNGLGQYLTKDMLNVDDVRELNESIFSYEKMRKDLENA